MNFKLFMIITALMLLSLTSFAATKPLNSPQGLAIDTKGNLYVANSDGNDILIYNANYVQQTGKIFRRTSVPPQA